MNHGNFNEDEYWTRYFEQFTESYLPPVAEQEFANDQFQLFGTTTNIAAAGSEIMRPDVTTKQILQHEVIPSQIANNNTIKETSGVDPAKLERKRKIDREYRKRCKDNKKKTEDELKVLRKENALLHGRLQQFKNSKQQMLELKPDGEQNDSGQLCKIEFRLDCYNEKLRGEAMKIVGEFPGLKWFSMDIEEKKLTLYGKDIDTLPLQNKLKEICNARMLSFSIVTKKDEEKKEGRIIMDMVVARSSTRVAKNSVPMSCTDSAYPNVRPSEECFHLTEAAFISFTSLPARCCGLF